MSKSAFPERPPLTQQGGSQTISNYITIAKGFTSTSSLTVSGGTLQDNGSTYVGGASTTRWRVRRT